MQDIPNLQDLWEAMHKIVFKVSPYLDWYETIQNITDCSSFKKLDVYQDKK